MEGNYKNSFPEPIPVIQDETVTLRFYFRALYHRPEPFFKEEKFTNGPPRTRLYTLTPSLTQA